MEFTHLHGHSTYSFLEAIGTPKKLIAKAKEMGFTAFGLTDLYSMYGAIQLYESAKDNEINPIIGTELGFVLDINGFNKVEDIGNICLLAKNTEGYQNLMKIVSVANQAGINGKPKIDISTLKDLGKEIIVFMGGIDSWIGKMVAKSEKIGKISEILNMIEDTIGKENIYLEMVAQDENMVNGLKSINQTILSLSKSHNLGIIVGNIYNYIEKKDKETREIALAIKDNKRMFDGDRRKPIGEFYLMSGDEIKAILLDNGYNSEQIDMWIKNNNNIATQVNIEIKMHQSLFPVYQTPKDVADLYESVKDGLVCE